MKLPALKGGACGALAGHNRLMEPPGKPMVPFNRPCGATLPIKAGTGWPNDGAFLPVCIGGFPTAEAKEPSHRLRNLEVVP